MSRAEAQTTQLFVKLLQRVWGCQPPSLPLRLPFCPLQPLQARSLQHTPGVSPHWNSSQGLLHVLKFTHITVCVWGGGSFLFKRHLQL